jgi:hypothetical protein
MLRQRVELFIIVVALINLACAATQHVLWKPPSSSTEAWFIKVSPSPFGHEIKIIIDGTTVIAGNCATDKKAEYNADYQNRHIKALMTYEMPTHEEHVDVYVDESLVGTFVF